jgi:hypothetical protein
LFNGYHFPSCGARKHERQTDASAFTQAPITLTRIFPSITNIFSTHKTQNRLNTRARIKNGIKEKRDKTRLSRKNLRLFVLLSRRLPA